MRRHQVLILLWILTIAMLIAGFTYEPVFAVFAQLAAIGCAVLTVVRTQRLGVLRYKWIYRICLCVLLAATGTVLVCAGRTVAFGSEGHAVVGFIALATTNLLAAVLAWRALTNPDRRRAAVVGLMVVVAELVALIIDAVISVKFDYHPDDFGVVALFASFAATWAGALVCIAALVSFDPAPMYIVPDARVVDDK